MKSPTSFTALLREQGYSEAAIEEICKWYVCSTTEEPTAKLKQNPNN